MTYRLSRPLRILLYAAMAIAVPLGWFLVPHLRESVYGPPVSSHYVVENGVVAYRPMSPGERIAATIMTLGLAWNAEAVRGREMPAADPASFRPLDLKHAVDRNTAWFKADPIPGSNPERFVVAAFDFAYDEARIWKGSKLVFQRSGTADVPVTAHSESIFSIGETSYWLGDTPEPLPESPATPPQHHCRDWFTMNGALWRATTRVLAFEKAPEILDCDSGIRTDYVDGVGRENLADNSGILLREGDRLLRVRRDGTLTTLAPFVEGIDEVQLHEGAQSDSFLLIRTVSGEVHALDALHPGLTQNLGRLAALPKPQGDGFGELWLGDRFFLPNENRKTSDDPFVIDLGPARQLGNWALAGDTLYWHERPVAKPGDAPLRLVTKDVLLVGASCLESGRFVTDLPDPGAMTDAVITLCANRADGDDVLYDGLRIGFAPNFMQTGTTPGDRELLDFRLGEVVIENTTDSARTMPEIFFEFAVSGRGTYRFTVVPSPEADPTMDRTLAPGARRVAPLNIKTDDPDIFLSWQLKLRHLPKKAMTFGAEPVTIVFGHLPRNP